MDPIIFEELSYEENQLENTGVYTACNFSQEKVPGRRRYFIGR
jgi:hypothetical protein